MAKRWPWQKSERATASWWIVVLAGTLVVVFSVAIVREVIRSREVRTQVDRLEEQVLQEEERYTQLEELITYLGSQTFQEREARLKLGLRKPGERVIVVPPGSVDLPNANGTNTNQLLGSAGIQDEAGFPQRWWKYFFGPKEDLPKNDSAT